MAALRDLGALPPDTDLRAVIRDLGLDQPLVDPTTLTGDEIVKEVQRVVKALLGYGARMPKELMLYVKNMVFLDGAIARLAPDLDILAEIATISVGVRPAPRRPDRPGPGFDPDRSSSTSTASRPASASTRTSSASPTASCASAAPSSNNACEIGTVDPHPSVEGHRSVGGRETRPPTLRWIASPRCGS